MSKLCNGKRAARKAQGFELSPARCLNCQNYVPPVHGAIPVARRAGLPYRPPACGLGGFTVKVSSICDKWVGSRGEVLEE